MLIQFIKIRYSQELPTTKLKQLISPIVIIFRCGTKYSVFPFHIFPSISAFSRYCFRKTITNRLGINLSISQIHDRSFYRVLNPVLGVISPQFYWYFGGYFETPLCSQNDTSNASNWKYLYGFSEYGHNSCKFSDILLQHTLRRGGTSYQ